jgi:hypothetical protein
MATRTSGEGEGNRDADPAEDRERRRDPDRDGSGRNRRRAALAVAPFLAIGLADVLLLLFWGIEPLWAFAILPPILFCSVLAWIVFSTDFLEDRT